MLVTLTFISWMAHWAYGVLCIVAAAAMFIFLRIKLGYEENIPKYMKRISKANQIHEQDVQMANQWIQFLEKNSLISKDQSTELTERLKNLQNKLSVEGNHT